MIDDFWGPPAGTIDSILAGPRRAYWSLDHDDRPDYQELETIQPRLVERFPNGKRVVTYRPNGEIESIDEIVYEFRWPKEQK